MIPPYECAPFIEPIEFRSAGDQRIVASGIAIRYGAISKPMRGFRERIEPGAATKTLQEQDIVALHEHDPRMLLGRTSSGTLRLADGPGELRYEIDLPDTSAGRDVAHLLERGDIKGASFGFTAIPSSVKWTKTDDPKLALRSIGELRMRDISTTCIPAYAESTAEIALRSLAHQADVEVRSVIEAADQGCLAELIDPRTRETEPTEAPHDGRETTVARPRISWLY